MLTKKIIQNVRLSIEHDKNNTMFRHISNFFVNYRFLKHLFLYLALAFALPHLCYADDVPDGFSDHVNHLKEEAKSKGISSKVIDETLGKVTYVNHVIKLENTQVVYFNFPLYFKRFAAPDRIKEGRRVLKENQRLLNHIEKKYHVSKYMLVALWGMESHYGTMKGSYNIINALTTLSFEKRRGAFFKNELFASLAIIQSGQRTPSNFLSGWAGASGDFQFMPTTYLAYAVDFDHDGKKNIWEDKADALASAANYLKKIGWKNDQPWGTEVHLPEKLYDIKYTGPKNTHTLLEWKRMGVHLMHDYPHLNHQKAILYLPVGKHGPAFLVFNNFNVIYQWNRSINYSLTASLIADTLKNPRHPYHFHFSNKLISLTTDDIRSIQNGLKKLNLLQGNVDGQMGNQTRMAIASFQRLHHMSADGYPDKKFIKIFKQTVLLS